MTVKHDSNGDGVVRLGTRDWIYLIILIASAAIGVIARIDYAERSMDAKYEALRSKWQREAPSPAFWTKDNIGRLWESVRDLDGRVRETEKAR